MEHMGMLLRCHFAPQMLEKTEVIGRHHPFDEFQEKKCGWDDGIIILFLQLNIKTILKTNNMLETMNLIYLYFPILYPQSITLLKSQRITVNHHFRWLDHVKSQFLQNSTSCCPGSKKNITIVPFVLLRFAHFD